MRHRDREYLLSSPDPGSHRGRARKYGSFRSVPPRTKSATTVPINRPSLLLLFPITLLSFSPFVLSSPPAISHLKMITYTQVRNDRGYEPAVCGYRYVTLVSTCRRHYPLAQRAILKIEKRFIL